MLHCLYVASLVVLSWIGIALSAAAAFCGVVELTAWAERKRNNNLIQ